MSFKKINFLFIALIITVFSACEKEDSASSSNTNTSKAGKFKGPFTFKDDYTDTSIQNYEFNLTKIADNKYQILSVDSGFELEVLENNGALSLPDELKAFFTNFSGTINDNSLVIQGNGDDDGNLFQFTYVGTKVNTPTPPLADDYFIFDDSTIICDPDYTDCNFVNASYSYYIFGIYNRSNINNPSTGGHLTVKTKNTPSPGTYTVVDYEKFYNDDLGPDECVVNTSKINYSQSFYSTGDNGTLTVTQKDGKLVFELNNVSIAPAGRTPILNMSKARGYCR